MGNKLGTKDLENQEYFHGYVSRRDAATLLTEDGDFLVRKTEGNLEAGKPGTDCLSVMWGGKPCHFLFPNSTSLTPSAPPDTASTQSSGTLGKDTVDLSQFKTVVDMINYLKKTDSSMSAGGAKLLRPVVRQLWELRHNQLQVRNMLGKGEYGAVYSGKLKLDSGKKMEVAAKELNTLRGKRDRESFFAEARHMRQLSHPNIIQIIGVCALRPPFFLVMELAPNGSLLNLLRMEGLKMKDKTKETFVVQACKGMAYLESKNIIHRDLAARNCLLGKRNRLKIADFGLSKNRTVYRVRTVEKLPKRWMSPETHKSGEFSSDSDVWSFGILIWEIYSNGAKPYPGIPETEIQKAIVVDGVKLDPPDGCRNKWIIGIMRSCQYPAGIRPPFKILLESLQKRLNIYK